MCFLLFLIAPHPQQDDNATKNHGVTGSGRERGDFSEEKGQ